MSNAKWLKVELVSDQLETKRTEPNRTPHIHVTPALLTLPEPGAPISDMIDTIGEIGVVPMSKFRD